MTVRIDGKTGTRLASVDITDPTGHGVQVIRSFDTYLGALTVHDCLLSGIRDFSTRTLMERVRVLRNGKDGVAYNGDGILLQGFDHTLIDPTIEDNGDSFDYEHGIYAVGLRYRILRPVCRGNAASGIKAGGTGEIIGGARPDGQLAEISGSVRGLIYDKSGVGIKVRWLRVSGRAYAAHLLNGADPALFDVDENVYPFPTGGPRPAFNDSRTGRQYDLAGWQNATGFDRHSVLEELAAPVPGPTPTPTPTPTKPKPPKGRK